MPGLTKKKKKTFTFISPRQDSFRSGLFKKKHWEVVPLHVHPLLTECIISQAIKESYLEGQAKSNSCGLRQMLNRALLPKSYKLVTSGASKRCIASNI